MDKLEAKEPPSPVPQLGRKEGRTKPRRRRSYRHGAGENSYKTGVTGQLRNRPPVSPQPAVEPLEMTKRIKPASAQEAAASIPPQRTPGHFTNQGGAHLLLILEVREPLGGSSLSNIKASSTTKQWSQCEIGRWVLCLRLLREERGDSRG